MNLVRILLLEDNAGDAYLVKEQLKEIDRAKFEIEEAQSLEQATDLLRSNFYDAILLDLTLPDCRGLETFVRVNQHAVSTAIVIISGTTEEELAIKAVKEGAQDYLEKGKIQPHTLYKTIQYAIERKSIAEQLIERTQELEFANQELEAFNYTVSHDLRNPLSFIKGMSSLLLNKKRAHPLEEQDRLCLERIHRSSIRIEQITKNLLDLSLAQRSQITLAKIDLAKIASKVANSLQQLQPQREVNFIIAPNLFAEADELLIELVLENLLGNAWKYTQSVDRPAIEFGKQERDSQTAYYVKDNGIGFAVEADEARLLFVPFKRLSNSSGFEGTGIGLATVKNIVERHQGQVWCESEAGKGAIFYFTLNPQPK